MSINFKHTINSNSMAEVIDKVTKQLQTAGFGVLTNIDFAAKLKEKINVDIPETVVLGACNPKLAYEVYQEDTDFLSLLPCNIVIRKLPTNAYSIEMIKPSEMMKPLANQNISNMAAKMDEEMLDVLKNIS